jgi:glycosyltransferase involved in cell wall biosynthesis
MIDAGERRTAVVARGIDLKVCYLLADYRSHRRAGLDNLRCLSNAGLTIVDDPADADVVVIHDEPATYPSYFRAFPVLRQRYTVAYAVWEPGVLAPDLFRWFGLVDEIWTASSYCARIVSQAGNPVTVVPHWVAPPHPDGEAERKLKARLGLADPTPFVFYSISRSEERKNIAASLRAYAASGLADRSVYIVRTPTPLPEQLATIPGVVTPSGSFEDDEIAALHGIGQCCVSPHCAEGWGLSLSDAMACGNLVVATGYSGNMDYMTDANALPVGYTIDAIRLPETRIRFGFPAASTAPKWAYVDEDQLAARLVEALVQWDDLESLRQAAHATMQRYDEASVSAVMLARLDVIARNPVPRAAGPARSSARPMG